MEKQEIMTLKIKCYCSKGLAGVVLFVCLFGFSCVKFPSNYTARDFIVVETTMDDNLESLARTYLHDAKKAWMISEFNKIKELKPGQRIIIPLKPFNKGGLSPEGYQMASVLCFGLTESKVNQDRKDGKISVRQGFETHLNYLKSNNYHVITMNELMDFIAYRGQIPEKSVVITLDDHSNAITEWVLPTLVSYGYPATVFVDAREMGKGNNLSFEGIRPFLSKGISVGSRSGWSIDSEVEQNQIGFKEYFENLEKEIAFSKNVLEKETGKPCLYYAYPPSGNYNLIVNFLKKYEFKAGFTLNGEPNPFFADSLAVHRIEVPAVCSLEDFDRKLVVFNKMELR